MIFDDNSEIILLISSLKLCCGFSLESPCRGDSNEHPQHRFLAHLSQRLTGELIVYPCSGIRRCRRRCPPFSNVFSSETAWPIKAKFHVEPPWEGGTKACINGPGHMTKMAAMPIYGKNLKKSSSPEPAGRFPRNFICSIGDSCPS